MILRAHMQSKVTDQPRCLRSQWWAICLLEVVHEVRIIQKVAIQISTDYRDAKTWFLMKGTLIRPAADRLKFADAALFSPLNIMQVVFREKKKKKTSLIIDLCYTKRQISMHHSAVPLEFYLYPWIPFAVIELCYGVLMFKSQCCHM